MQNYQLMAQKEEQAEQIAKLTAAEHIVQSHFSQHEQIEEGDGIRKSSAFSGCDRLLKISSVYGSVQLGYHPQMGYSFLSASVKSSVWDSSPARRRYAFQEYQADHKRQTKHLSVSTRQEQNSSVVLYKPGNVSWSKNSVAPYLNQVSPMSMKRTLPFLTQGEEQKERELGIEQYKALGTQLTEQMRKGNFSQLTNLRRQQYDLMSRHNYINVVLTLKEQKRRWFFQQINRAFDGQKKELFAYYRSSFAEIESERSTPRLSSSSEGENLG